MHVLVTGGSGFLGATLAARCAARGDRVTILDLTSPPSSLVPQVRFVQGDVRDRTRVADALAGVDLVLHLAAAHHDFGISPSTYFSVNEGSAEVLSREMTSAKVNRICFYSSVAVYGTAPEPRAEETQPAPTTTYGASKLAGEHVFRRWVEAAAGRQALVVRPTMTFGPGNFANMYNLIRQIHRRRFLEVGTGRNAKSVAYVDNLVDATLFLLGREVRQPFDIFNYVDEPPPRSAEISNAIRLALGRSPARFRLPLSLTLALAWPLDLVAWITGRNLPITAARIRKLAQSRTVYSGEKIRAAGFRAEVTLVEGIRRMVDWYLHEGHAMVADPRIPPAWQAA